MEDRDCETDLHWLERYFDRTYHMDERGRMRQREATHAGVLPSPGVPRFAFGRTSHGNGWRFRNDLPRAVVLGLTRLAGRERLFVGPLFETAPPERLEPFCKVCCPDSRDRHVLRLSLWRDGRSGNVLTRTWSRSQDDEESHWEAFGDVHLIF